MKTTTGRHTHSRRMHKPKDEGHDAYRPGGKLAEPAVCSACGAVWRGGRWRWEGADFGARAVLCPACHRVRDGLPAGYVKLEGEFFAGHRDEILACVRRCERAEKKSHPLQRIMAIEANGEGWIVTTTDSHLARRIGEALKSAFKGRAAFSYQAQDNLLRVTWSRAR
ncbi:MAG TPA: BCAM0308 family protein [Burkholderiales bacterium]|nr:BCAM0308 family protein [Burkholderiales bacterium]